jgi:hypothetical protein
MFEEGLDKKRAAVQGRSLTKDSIHRRLSDEIVA